MTKHAFPRLRGIIAVHASPRQTDLAEMIAGLNQDWETFKASQRSVDTENRKLIDDINVKLAALGMNGIGGGATPPDPRYTATFASWVRNGQNDDDLRSAQREGVRSAIHASMSVGTPSSGGYLAPVEWDRRINAELEPLSPLRRLATVQVTTVAGFTTLWTDRAWGSGWVGETATRPQTSTPTFDPLEFSAGEIYANPAITQRLLDDADFGLETWIASEIAAEFARQESPAFIAGNGVNKPRGFLTYVDGGASDGHHPGGNLVVVPSGSTSDIGTPDSLIDFVYGLPSPYRRNAVWLMNSMTAARFAKLKDAEDRYLWQQSYVAGQPSTLLGYPVEIDEGMPDVATEALAVAFGDFNRGYIINDRMGVRMLRDPYTNKPYVHFYSTKRVGGGVWDPKAIRLLKIATAEAPGG